MAITIFLLLGVAVVIFVILILRFLSESGSTRFILTNDSEAAITYSVLHDDGDNSRNKTLRKPVVLEARNQSEIKIYGSTYCVFIYENRAVTRSVALMDQDVDSQSATSSVSAVPNFLLSKLKQPCPFNSDFSFDR